MADTPNPRSEGADRTSDPDNSATLNQLRSELLADRADSLNRWLGVVGIILSFFGVVVAIAGYIGYTSFSKLANEMEVHVEFARKAVARIEQHRLDASSIVEKLRKQVEATSPREAGTTRGPASLGSDEFTLEPLPLVSLGLIPFTTESGSLGQGSATRLEIHLPDPRDYWFVAECDENCGDLDLSVYGVPISAGNETSQLLDEDSLPDASPVVHQRALESGPIQIEVRMYDCRVSQCEWELTGYLDATASDFR